MGLKIMLSRFCLVSAELENGILSFNQTSNHNILELTNIESQYNFQWQYRKYQ